MSSVPGLYYLMPIKQISMPGITAIMRWFITSKARAKYESSTVSIKKWMEKLSLNCMIRSMIKQMCQTSDIILKIRENTFGKDASFALCIHILYGCHKILGKAYSSLGWMGSGRQHYWIDADLQLYNSSITIFALFRKIVQTGVVPYSEIAHFSGFLSRGTTK